MVPFLIDLKFTPHQKPSIFLPSHREGPLLGPLVKGDFLYYISPVFLPVLSIFYSENGSGTAYNLEMSQIAQRKFEEFFSDFGRFYVLVRLLRRQIPIQSTSDRTSGI